MTKSKIPWIPVFGLIFTIAFFITLLVTATNKNEERFDQCKSLGFDFVDFSYSNSPPGEHVCVKEMHYDPFTGKQVFCYMPIEKSVHATEWCRDDQ